MSLQPQTLEAPFQEEAVLKENRYKKVSLMMDGAGTLFICKTYQGRDAIYSQANAEYAFRILQFFSENFYPVAKIPRVYSREGESIYLEYLPELRTASLLSAKSIGLANRFFERCYEFNQMIEPFRSVQQSVYYSESMEKWLELNKPLALGLKGDLWQNLCISNGTLILADIDSTATEPLGFSEIVMHAEVHAQLSLGNFRNKMLYSPTRPVCFDILSREDSIFLIDLALQFVSSRMMHLPSLVRATKIRLARTSIERSLNHYA